MMDSWMNTTKFREVVMSALENSYLQGLMQRALEANSSGNGTRCTTRKEVRLMSEEEWNNFTDCMKVLYHKVIDPSTGKTAYQLFVGNHRSATAPGAHGGCCFLCWHAIFLKVFELALQDCNPTVCVPYIEWRAEYAAMDHCDSNIYCDELYGNNQGPVISGFQAGQTVYPSDCNTIPVGSVAATNYLVRNCEPLVNQPLLALVSYETYDILYETFTNLVDLCSPWNTTFEDAHGTLHSDKGGQVSVVSCSVNDALFWSIHGHVDNQHNRMREKFADPIKQLGTYPRESQGYTGITADNQYNAPAKPYTKWTCEDGLKITSTYGVKYERVPEHCVTDDDCNWTPNNRKGFYCSEGGIRRCVAKRRINGKCTQHNQCYREKFCTIEPKCIIWPPYLGFICRCDAFLAWLG